jgi:hypothetical protein
VADDIGGRGLPANDTVVYTVRATTRSLAG